MKVFQLKVLISLIFLLPFLNLFAQVKSISKVAIRNKMQVMEVNNPVKAKNFFSASAQRMGLNQNDEMVLKSEMKGENNFTYKKFEQIHQGIPVFGSAYTLRIQSGHVKKASGYYLPMVDVDTKPTISADHAISFAKQKMKAKKYSWEDNNWNKMPGYAEKPSAKLVIIDAAFPDASEYYKLAYQIDLHSVEPMDKKRYFIDAQNGQVLLDLPLLMHVGTPAKGQSKYYGEVDITVDSIAPNQFQLHDPTRGNGNTVFNQDGRIFESQDNTWDLTNADQDEVAIDAHYCTERFYDFMLNTFNWNGIDNEGGSMNSIIHIAPIVDAFWDGESAIFGDGDCHHGPLTTLEVVGHEFMHGVTQNSSKLIGGEREAAAINESISDIFGKALEFYEDPDNFSWIYGESYLLSQFGEPLRSFIDPNLFEHPKLYQGMFWSDDNAASTNSSVGNHWFYLLVNGGNGINEAGFSYNIEGIGFEKALEIVFQTQITALVSNSNYSFYQVSTEMIAEELFGENSAELTAVQIAWEAVGVVTLDPLEDELILEVTLEDPGQTCLNGEFFEANFSIANLGTKAYVPKINSGVIELNYSGTSRFINIDQEILPNEVLNFTVDDFFFVDSGNNTVNLFRLTLDWVDGIFKSDRASIILQNFTNINNDLFIVDNNNNLTLASFCGKDDVDLSFEIGNRSCNPIFAGTPFELTIKNEEGQNIWSKSNQVSINLITNESYILEETISMSILDGGLYTVELGFDEDTNTENNNDQFFIPTQEVIGEGYRQTFESEQLDRLVFSPGTRGFIEVPFTFGFENYFAVGARSSSSEPLSCFFAGIEDVFTAQRPSLEMCIDTEDMLNPELSFDLIQFRKEEEDLEFPEFSDRTNVVKVSWTDGANDFEEIIFDQIEGQIQNKTFDLPKSTIGLARIEFFLHDTDGNDDAEMLESDLTLLDNLVIGESTTTSVKDELKNKITLQPNPSTGLVQVNYPDQPDALFVTNIHGQEVLRIAPNANSQELDIRHLPPGSYAISLMYQNQLSTSLILKIDE